MNKKRKTIFIIIIFLLSIAALAGGYYLQQKNISIINERKRQAIAKHYNELVHTNKNAKLYTYDNDNLIVIGNISKDSELKLEKTTVTSDYQYFKIANQDLPYYINYEDVSPIESISEFSKRYLKYIPFNTNIVTNNITNFYDEEDNLIYTINKSFDLPIIIKETDKYGIEYNKRLLYIKKEDVKETKENKNTELQNTEHIGVLNYHFFWDDSTEKSSACNQTICLSTSSFKKQLDAINELQLLTIKMSELEMYIDGKIQLPKSVVITIDDGWRCDAGVKILNEYKMYATLFLITSSYPPEYYHSEYVELHSHSDKLHDGGKCPGGQGGGIKCLPRDTILNDLKTSREKLDGSTVFCYPFYEYNNYAIGLLKEAGFTMAFAGKNGQDNNYVKVGSSKYTLPRYVIYSNTNVNSLKNYLSK